MPAIRDTAYPYLKAIPSRGDLKRLFTPTRAELKSCPSSLLAASGARLFLGADENLSRAGLLRSPARRPAA
jgi:hypothetical protein